MLPGPPPQGTNRGRELESWMRHIVERTTPEELVQILDVVIVRHGWPRFASKTLMRAVVRELSAKG